MTKEILEDYRYNLLELEEYDKGKRNAHDTVKGSSSEFPYSSHSVSIYGIPNEREELVQKLKKQCAEVEQFIAKLPNSYCRLLVRYRIMKAMEWEEVGALLNKSENAVKNDYSNLLKKLN